MRSIIASLMLVSAVIGTAAYVESATPPAITSSSPGDAQSIAIAGPATAAPGEEITLRLTGTPAVDLAKPWGEQLGWLIGPDRLLAHLAAPGRPLAPVAVRGELVFAADGGGIQMEPLIRLVIGGPGEYRLIVAWHYGFRQVIDHVVTVGGDAKPDPKPDPKPSPAIAMWGVIIEERSQRTQLPPQQRLVFEAAAVRELFAAGKFHTVDQHKPDPGAMKPYIERAATMTLPVLFLVDDEGNVAHEGPLPATVAETVALAQQHLAK